jgi:hypothetical protein
MKVFLSGRTNLNEGMIRENFEMVNSTKEADIVICQSTLPHDFDGNFGKIIYIAVEPPLADHRLFCYEHFKDFLLVVTHNASLDRNDDNQWFFTDSNEPQYYPTNPLPSNVQLCEYPDKKVGDEIRGVFYAGMIGPYESQPNCYGGINLTKLRRELGEYIKQNVPGSKIIGIGWNGQQIKVQDWRADKSNQIKESGCDFVLALENTMLPNYLYEKIWDGFASDKVTLYLGDPNIEQHIPLNCFIDLRDYFDKSTGAFDFRELLIRLETMSTQEYNEIRKNARIFRATAYGRYPELQDKLTNKLIKFLKDINI